MGVTQEAEEGWMQLILSGQSLLQGPDCTPGYYNNEGHPEDPRIRYFVGYPFGPRVRTSNTSRIGAATVGSKV